MIDCGAAIERLPWLLNGSLAEPERDAVRQHLAACAACRQEWQETASAAAIYGQHVPAATLVEYAFGRATDLDVDLIEQHVRVCQSCEGELALVRESRRLEAGQRAAGRDAGATEKGVRATAIAGAEQAAGGDAAATEKRPVGWRFDWRSAGIAAAAVLAVGVLLEQRRARAPDSGPASVIPEARVQPSFKPPAPQAATDAGRASDTAAIAKLESELAQHRSPQVNTTTLDVFPVGLAERSAQASQAAAEVRIPRAPSQATLILNSQSPAAYPRYAIEIRDAQDARVWRGDGLVRHATGDYTMTLSPSFLRPGRYTFVVYGEGRGSSVPIERYRIRVE